MSEPDLESLTQRLLKATIPGLLDKLFYTDKVIRKAELYKKAKAANPAVTHKIVDDFLKDQISIQLHKVPVRPVRYSPIVADEPFEHMQSDLCFYEDLSRYNHGYKYLMTVVDIFTRKGWLIPLKTKHVVPAFRAAFESGGIPVPSKLTTDNGSEYSNAEFKALCDEYKIHHVIARTGNHSAVGIIERFNRTIKRHIGIHLSQTGNLDAKDVWHQGKNWIDVLPQIIRNYNSSKHRILGMSPDDASKPDNVKKLKEAVYWRRADEKLEEALRDPIKKGTWVRIRKDDTPFQKESKPRWSEDIYITQGKEGSTYIVNGERYSHWQLQRVPQPDDEKKDS